MHVQEESGEQLDRGGFVPPFWAAFRCFDMFGAFEAAMRRRLSGCMKQCRLLLQSRLPADKPGGFMLYARLILHACVVNCLTSCGLQAEEDKQSVDVGLVFAQEGGECG